MATRSIVFGCLSRSRLLELANANGLSGLTGKSKDQVVEALAGARRVPTRGILEALTRDELKAICGECGLDEGGREKSPLIDRILGNDGNGVVDPAPAPATGSSSSTRMARKPIEQYDHKDKTRPNNPPVGLVNKDTEPAESPKKTYIYDPHLDPALSFDPQAIRQTISRIIDDGLGDDAAAAAADPAPAASTLAENKLGETQAKLARAEESLKRARRALKVGLAKGD